MLDNRHMPRKVVIVGGGASGVIFAVNLARASSDTDITIIERRADLGRGLAYSTKDPTHLLNVRAANMSAFADDPEHFFRWLQNYELQHYDPQHGPATPTHFSFAPRKVYGEYLAGLLEKETPHGVRILHASVEDIAELPGEVRVKLADGALFSADAVVIATGNDPQAELPDSATMNPWSPGAFDNLPPDAPVMIIGTGLTMADVMLSLHRSGHHGRVLAVSRRGLRSTVHADVTARPLAADQIPFGAPLSELTGWLRTLVRLCEAEGKGWRSAIDSLRPHTRRLWQSMDLQQRKRFLRHARPWWEAHRHRMAPTVALMIGNLIADNRLNILAAKVMKLEKTGNAVRATLRQRGT